MFDVSAYRTTSKRETLYRAPHRFRTTLQLFNEKKVSGFMFKRHTHAHLLLPLQHFRQLPQSGPDRSLVSIVCGSGLPFSGLGAATLFPWFPLMNSLCLTLPSLQCPSVRHVVPPIVRLADFGFLPREVRYSLKRRY